MPGQGLAACGRPGGRRLRAGACTPPGLDDHMLFPHANFSLPTAHGRGSERSPWTRVDGEAQELQFRSWPIWPPSAANGPCAGRPEATVSRIHGFSDPRFLGGNSSEACWPAKQQTAQNHEQREPPRTRFIATRDITAKRANQDAPTRMRLLPVESGVAGLRRQNNSRSSLTSVSFSVVFGEQE